MNKLKLTLLALLTSQMMFAQNTMESGYRGFFDGGYTIGIGDYDFGRFEINTSHGYQINPVLFIGGGVGMHFMPEYETKGTSTIPLDKRESKVDIPVFANVRVNLINGKFAPFIDGKAGTYLTNGGGLYLNLSAGCLMALNATQGVTFSVGYTIEELEFQTFKSFISSASMNYTRSPRKLKTEGIALKIGYQF